MLHPVVPLRSNFAVSPACILVTFSIRDSILAWGWWRSSVVQITSIHLPQEDDVSISKLLGSSKFVGRDARHLLREKRLNSNFETYGDNSVFSKEFWPNYAILGSLGTKFSKNLTVKVQNRNAEKPARNDK